MRTYTLSLVAAFTLFTLPLTLSAQTDSTRYDIGFLSLNKAFTQQITIKGEDLEKMPCVNLSDALRAWLFGAYVQPGMLAYVVDGNPVTDVNIYPIYDIEEVTCIHNAVATAAYGNSLQDLVLITTRRGRAREGIRFAAQTGIVKGNPEGYDTHTGVYHQYYLGAYGTRDKMSFGASAGWQRDILPAIVSPYQNVFLPDNLQRWRLNGWLEWSPDPRNTLRVTLGYAPQRTESGETSMVIEPFNGLTDKVSDHLLVPALSWEHRWARGWRNQFDAGYLHRTGQEDFDQSDSNTYLGRSYLEFTNSRMNGKADHLVLRDRLSLEEKKGLWQFVPALDVSYQRIHERSDFFQFRESVSTAGATEVLSEEKANLFYLTPAVDVTLSKAWNIGAGVLVNAGSKAEVWDSRFFPFATTAIDLLHLNNKARTSSLKLFGSYARRPLVYVNDYSVGDLSGDGGGQNLYEVYHPPSNYFTDNVVNAFPGLVGNEPGYWTWQTGAAFSTAKGRVSVQYGFERRNFSQVILNNIYSIYGPWTENFHHVDLRFRVIDLTETRWLTAFNMTLVRPSDGVGNAFSGGWVNRFQSGRFSAGLDLVYLFHSGDSLSNPILPSKVNYVDVSNIYAGYKWKLGSGLLELFVQGSTLRQREQSYLPYLRKVYTIGGKWEL
jgi:hypothetical protein